eukprot:maker-scaffold_6-snap-gene-0.55-mRNA-1 protein AED:0.01 eAED:0.01 QI:56/1/1/1/1/1/3/901/232
MARNQEKAKTLLNRWTSFNTLLRLGPRKSSKPKIPAHTTSIEEARAGRKKTVGFMLQKAEMLNDRTLGEYRLRELNEEMNTLIKQKENWERRIVKLGGKDLSRIRILDDEGQGISGSEGFKYFGAARDLPGVRELLNQDFSVPKRRRLDPKNLDLDYFGFGNENLGKELQKEELHQNFIFADDSRSESSASSKEYSETEEKKLEVFEKEQKEREAKELAIKKQELLDQLKLS